MIKLSLTGLGFTSIAAGSISWLCCHCLGNSVTPQLRRKFSRLFATTVVLHTGIYIALIAKMLLMDELADFPGFLLSHLLLHQILSALISAPLVLMAVDIYNCRRQLKIQLMGTGNHQSAKSS
ncbi:hypothetical protein [Shewanella sp. GXUN23E]|uniref:hypothetical protein n=1 Tax=Shewanella sp. GXUN23E TaxID=3422498 RepID=UPI003D7C77F6